MYKKNPEINLRRLVLFRSFGSFEENAGDMGKNGAEIDF